MSAPNPEKGARYLVSLDQALCNANWSEIAELARKVDKHAPERSCLTLAARAESQVASASHRPTSASSIASTSIHGLGELVPRLLEAISAASNSHADDAYVASTCLAEIHWLREAPVEALKTLSDVGAVPTASKSGAGPLGWLEVCEVKATFIRASCLDSSGRAEEAREVYQASVRRTPGSRTPELRQWTERLLARACMYSVQKMPSPTSQEYSRTHSAFQAWGVFWQRTPMSSTGAGASTTRLDVPRRQVWKAYYDLLSTMVQRGLTSNAHVTASQETEGRLLEPKRAQRAEIKQVEATYESLLLAETQFPKASQSNIEVEDWVEQVMSNWRLFSGPTWTDSDLGDGGRRAVSQTVLDILYRAATKTFHSTPILRHLFTIHAARGEFDLAMHAFNSYTEIIDRGKARAQKTGKHEIGFDDDDTTMLTAAEAVRLLCRYGDREQANKALEVAKVMQTWMEQPRPSVADTIHVNGEVGENGQPTGPSTASGLRTETLAAVYRAYGIAQAQWAQLTYESETRTSLFADAKKNLRRAQELDEASTETAHALAFVLAQMRDVSGSLDVIRTAIAAKEPHSNGDTHSATAFERQKRLISLWHLLALCLTAEDEYEAAANMCEAAFTQLGDFERLFGSGHEIQSNDPEKSTASLTTRGSIEQMDNCEKESMMQVKMTQIILSELMEGADDAVDQTDELFSLYTRLFGKPEHVIADIVARPPKTAVSQAPSRIGGTLKSITGSIRPKSVRSVRSSVEKDTVKQKSFISEEGAFTKPTEDGFSASANGTSLGPPIAITVTNEDGVDSPERPHPRGPHLPHLPFKGRGHQNSRSPVRGAAKAHGEKSSAELVQAVAGNESRPDQPLPEMAHNAPPEDWPPPPGHEDQPPQQDTRLPVPHPASAAALPEAQLAPIHERRHKLAVLVNTWLFSAELYTRAETYDDAENLINDAVKLTETLERELAAAEGGSSARKLFFKGWGKGKSIDELWADVWSTKAHLAMARQLPYDAMAAYEQALFHEPDHLTSIIGLSTLLMDIFEEKLPAEPPLRSSKPLPSASGSLINESTPRPAFTRPGTATTLPSRRPSIVVEPEPMETKERKIEPSPAELNRLAARDRAYMLLSNLTKQGAGWDDSEAWLTLARAHELSREIGKAKQALWWVVELENNRPIRPWKDACPGGLTV